MATILDCSGPYAAYGSRLLVEAGHRVVRVESPGGDAVRAMPPLLDPEHPLESGAYHLFWNAGKQSLALDLAAAPARAALDRLLARVDLLLTTTPTLLDLDAMVRAHPHLVVVAVSDAGPELCAWARSGLLSITGHPDRAPTILGGHIPLVVPGLHAAIAASSALLVQELTGKGQRVQVDAQDCLLSLMDQPMVDYTALGRVTGRLGDRGAATALAGSFPSADGYWVLSVPHMPDGWRNFMEWVQDPELMHDHSLEEESERRKRKEYVLSRLSTWARQQSTDQLVREAQERHVPASPVVTALDLAGDPQLAARGFLTKIDHPLLGSLDAPLGAHATPAGGRIGRAPLLGEHSRQLLTEFGVAPDQIDGLLTEQHRGERQ